MKKILPSVVDALKQARAANPQKSNVRITREVIEGVLMEDDELEEFFESMKQAYVGLQETIAMMNSFQLTEEQRAMLKEEEDLQRQRHEKRLEQLREESSEESSGEERGEEIRTIFKAGLDKCVEAARKEDPNLDEAAFRKSCRNLIIEAIVQSQE